MTRCDKHGVLNCALCSDRQRFLPDSTQNRSLDDPGAWSLEDDARLLSFIKAHPHPVWTKAIPVLMRAFSRRYAQIYMRGMRISGEGHSRGWLGQWPPLEETEERLRGVKIPMEELS